MGGLYKTAVFAVPVVAILLLLRTCSQMRGESFQTDIASIDESAKLVVDDDDLAVVSSHPELARAVRDEALSFRKFLIENHADLVGRGRDRRLSIAIFSSPGKLQDYAGDKMGRDPRAGRFAAWHDPRRSAVFLPPHSDFRTLRHEMVHWVMSVSYETAQIRSPWIGEGLAQYFEDGQDGLPIWDRRVATTMGSINWKRLIALNFSEFVAADSIGRNYQEAVLLVGFLLATDRRDTFVRYIERDRSRGGGDPMNFVVLFKATEPEFERDLRAYLQQPR